ncbi:hypothetical protein A2833_02020 [Candidatus Azambacteria bacterium RIFCSPHIGHO2_01_FULL_44_55]|nr:MAG: hypothetical protein A3C78_00050 [Candidatus Azambacteria bacterium RIFCSPHIGHO2_02_FULL_45_18]OGD39691.1 MAG: hypothetical protein A2833_02020 [Candidatus Azambacteria bacterium RIFCSPHIGHO2_01_FULL_44_55]
MDLKVEIKKFFKGDVLDDPATLALYSRDASLFYITPKVVVFPKDPADIEGLVSFVNQNKSANSDLSLTARSAGTDMSGGPLNESIIVEFNKYFNHIREVGEGYAVTEPGVFYRDFEAETLKKGLILPSFPASRGICALGGMLANNSGGEKSLNYGKTKDYVESSKVVLSDGKEHTFRKINKAELDQKMAQNDFEGDVYRKVFKLVDENFDEIQKAKPQVSKNSAGYNIFDVWDKQNFDLTKLFIGSQGTLGIITEARLKLIPVKKYAKILVIFLNDLNLIPKVVNEILPYKPESIETFDDNTFKLAIKFLPELLKKMQGGLITLGMKFLPEVWMTLTGGVPKIVLLPEFAEDDEEELERRIREVYEKLKPLGLKMRVTKNAFEADKYRIMRRESFNFLRQKVKDKQTAPFIDDFIVKPEKLPEFFPELYKILDQYPSLVYTIAGHAGDGNFHIIPLMNLTDPKQREIIPRLADQVFDLVIKYGGSITAEHNDGLIRSPYLEKMFGQSIIRIFEEIKDIFDSQNIFNPGKKVHADLQYALKHIRAK